MRILKEKNKLHRLLRTAAAAFLLVTLLTGCGAAQEEQPEKKADPAEDQISIGMCFDSFVIERWIRDRDVFLSAAESLGASVNVQSANGSAEEQIEQIRYLMEKDVDVLVVIPVDCDALSEVLQEAKKQGIRVMSYDRLAANADVDLYISFDNEEVGRLMGGALRDAIPDGGKLFMIGGPLPMTTWSWWSGAFMRYWTGRTWRWSICPGVRTGMPLTAMIM